MTAKAALCRALLSGKTLNVKNCFTMIGLTNCAREISRMVEQPFNVKIEKKRMDGKSRYGSPVTWFDYSLKDTEENREGIELMCDYVEKETGMKREQFSLFDKRHKEPTPKKNISVPTSSVIIQSIFD